MIKSIHQSKVVWLNIITFVLLVLALPQFLSVIPTGWIEYIALTNAALNGFLRIFFTSQPLTEIAAEQSPQQIPQ